MGQQHTVKAGQSGFRNATDALQNRDLCRLSWATATAFSSNPAFLTRCKTLQHLSLSFYLLTPSRLTSDEF